MKVSDHDTEQRKHKKRRKDKEKDRKKKKKKEKKHEKKSSQYRDNAAPPEAPSEVPTNPLSAARLGILSRLVEFAQIQGLENVLHLKDEQGNAPLHLAAAAGHVECVAWLLEHGAHANSVTYFGDTPLHLAAEARHVQTCQVLLQGGADGSIFNSVGISANNIMEGDTETHPEQEFHGERDSPEEERWEQKLWDQGAWGCESQDVMEQGFEESWRDQELACEQSSEEEYRRSILEQLKRKRQAEAWEERQRRVKEDAQRRAAAASAQAEELLRKERERDAAWRKAVAAKAAAKAAKRKLGDWKDYEDKWSELLQSSEEIMDVHKEIPWVTAVTVAELEQFLFSTLPDGPFHETKKARLRVEQLRWHPDKVAQRISGRIKDNGQKTLLVERATAISQLLNQLKSQLNS